MVGWRKEEEGNWGQLLTRIPVSPHVLLKDLANVEDGVRWLRGEGVGLVIRRLPDRFPAVPK